MEHYSAWQWHAVGTEAAAGKRDGAVGGAIVLMMTLDPMGAVLLMGGPIKGVIHLAEVEKESASAP